MKLRFTIKALLAVITCVALSIWWFDDGFHILYSESSASHGEIVIYGKRDRDSQKLLLRVKYSPTGVSSDNTHVSGPFEMRDDAQQFPTSFDSVIDGKSRYWCIYDNSNQDFVIVVAPKIKGRNVTESLWHPGIHIGWGRGFWDKIYRDIRKTNPQLPNQGLPGEMRLAPD